MHTILRNAYNLWVKAAEPFDALIFQSLRPALVNTMPIHTINISLITCLFSNTVFQPEAKKKDDD